MKKLLISTILFFLLTSAIAHASEQAAPGGASDTPVTITIPKKHRVRQIVLFPLELPAYVLRAVTWPIGVGSRYLVETGVVDRTLDFLSNKEKTLWVYPIIEGGAGSSFGGGLGIRHLNLFHRGYAAGAAYRVHINGDQRATGYFGQPKAFELANKIFSYEFDTEWLRYTGQDFYGIGNDSSQSNHSKYLVNKTDINAELAYHPLKRVGVALEIGTEIATTGPSTRDGYPSVNTMFPPSVIPAFSDWLTYLTVGLNLHYDTRDNKSFPGSGGLYEGSITRFQNTGSGSFDFNRYRIDLRHYIRVGKPRSVATIHTGWLFNQSTGGSQIPFWELATLDSSTPLRGFTRGRFTDKDLCVFNVEYRFPLWDQFDGVIFYDTGRVFPSPVDFSFNDFKQTIGGGLRVSLLGIMLFRFDAAYGGEGMNYMFGISRSL